MENPYSHNFETLFPACEVVSIKMSQTSMESTGIALPDICNLRLEKLAAHITCPQFATLQLSYIKVNGTYVWTN